MEEDLPDLSEETSGEVNMFSAVDFLVRFCALVGSGIFEMQNEDTKPVVTKVLHTVFTRALEVPFDPCTRQRIMELVVEAESVFNFAQDAKTLAHFQYVFPNTT